MLIVIYKIIITYSLITEAINVVGFMEEVIVAMYIFPNARVAILSSIFYEVYGTIIITTVGKVIYKHHITQNGPETEPVTKPNK